MKSRHKPHERENQSEDSQRSRQHRADLKNQKPVQRIEGFRHGLHVEDGQIGRHRLNHSFDLRNHGFRRGRCADLQGCERVGGIVLQNRHVEVWLDLAGHSCVTGIFGDADHGNGVTRDLRRF